MPIGEPLAILVRTDGPQDSRGGGEEKKKQRRCSAYLTLLTLLPD